VRRKYVKKIVESWIFNICYAADDDAGFFRNTAGFSVTDTAYSVRLKQIIGAEFKVHRISLISLIQRTLTDQHGRYSISAATKKRG
jgi:hypothetical protein